MRAPEPFNSETTGDRARLARSILDVARRAEDLGFAEAASFLRQAQKVAERTAEAGDAGLSN